MKKPYSIIIYFLLLALPIYQHAFAQQTSAVPAEAKENSYFRLDFVNQDYELSDVEDHFFTTFPHDDPTEGDVVYDRTRWVNKEMIKLTKNDGLYLYIKDRKDGKQFDSIRMTSKALYNLNKDNQQLLFVFKGKLPSVKGAWPAWWLNGSRQHEWTYQNIGFVSSDSDLDKYSGKGRFYETPSAVNSTDWPAAGEIDIIETINGDNVIHNTIHTCPQMCDSEWNNDGDIVNCANARPGDPNPGCSGRSYTVESMEGTFACIWQKNGLKFYYWAPSEDVRSAGGPLSENPDPDEWDKSNLKNEVRLLETDATCEDEAHQAWQCSSCDGANTCLFSNMKVIFNITLCGKWAGAKFDDSGKSLQNCQEYIVGEGRKAIDNQYIKIEYVSVSRLRS